MRVLRLTLAALLLPSAVALAQNSDTSWDKSYPLSGKPTLNLGVDDSSLNVHACGSCNAVHIHISVEGTTLSHYNLEESQSGNTVNFSLKEKSTSGFHVNWHNHQSVKVDVETPAELTASAHASDGSITLNGLRGALTVAASDGSLTIHEAAGTLDARTSDGSISVSGNFSGLQLATSDGSIQADLAQGSHLAQPSSIKASDGSISLHVPSTFPADIDLRSGDGSVHSNLPLTVENLDSGHRIHGKLDGGGAPLTIHTSDGSINLSRS